MKKVEVSLKRRGVSPVVTFTYKNIIGEFFHDVGLLAVHLLKREEVVTRQGGKINGVHYRLRQEKLFQDFIGYSSEDPLGAIPQIEGILEGIGIQEAKEIQFNKTYVEAYCVGDNKKLAHIYPVVQNDKSVYRGVLVDNLSVREVLEEVNGDIREEFQSFKIREVQDIIQQHMSTVENMSFVELYSFLKDSNYKANYRELCQQKFA